MNTFFFTSQLQSFTRYSKNRKKSRNIKKFPSTDSVYDAIVLQEFLDDGKGNVSGIKTVLVDWTKDDTGRWTMKERPGELQSHKTRNTRVVQG